MGQTKMVEVKPLEDEVIDGDLSAKPRYYSEPIYNNWTLIRPLYVGSVISDLFWSYHLSGRVMMNKE